MKNNKWTLLLLGPAVIAIWGYNLFQIVAGAPTEAAIGSTPSFDVAPARALQPATPQTPFTGAFRDPFIPPDMRRAGIAVAAEAGESQPEPPESWPGQTEPVTYLLTGIIGETAILAGSDGLVYVVSVGGDVGRARVRRVGPDHVLLQQGSDTIKLSLEEN